jgi:hypothetical protein
VSSARSAEVDDHEVEEESPGLWESFFTALRLIVGWFCIAIGVVNLLVEVDRVDGEPDTGYFFFHTMLFVGGLVLLSLPWLGRSPGLPGYVAGGLVAAAGMVVSGIMVTSSQCCLTVFQVRHGWPFAFVARNEATGEAGRWHIDSQHLLADLMFWAYVGLMVLVVIALLRRVTGNETPAAAALEDSTIATHAEQRAYIENGQNDGAAKGPAQDAPVRERADGT